MYNIGHSRIANDPRLEKAERDDALRYEATEQVKSKFIDGDYNEDVSYEFWNAEGEAQKELDRMFNEITSAYFDGKLDGKPEFAGIRKMLSEWEESKIEEQQNIILENAY